VKWRKPPILECLFLDSRADRWVSIKPILDKYHKCSIIKVYLSKKLNKLFSEWGMANRVPKSTACKRLAKTILVGEGILLPGVNASGDSIESIESCAWDLIENG